MIIPISSGLIASRALASGAAAWNTTIDTPWEKPRNAQHLSPRLMAFSIEMDRWTDWAGPQIGQPNEYVNQVLTNLGDRTGVMPFLRVGGHQDRATLHLDVPVLDGKFPPATDVTPKPEAEEVYIGRDFYALSGNLPAGTHFMWGLNMKSLNKTETVAQARQLGDAFQGSRKDVTANVYLENVEMGNEADYFGPNRIFANGTIGPWWNVSSYVNTWTDLANGIIEVIDMEGEGKPKFSLGGFTGNLSPVWGAGPILQQGILSDPALKARTDTWGVHWYHGQYRPTIESGPGVLMNTLNIRGNFSTRTPEIAPAKANDLRYVFTETNSYSNHGRPYISESVEGAIYTVNWLLLLASSGVERVHFHHGRGFAYNGIQAVAESEDSTGINRPHILPPYYGYLIVNEAIGKTGDSWVAELGTRNNTVSAYGVYENKQLVRIVITNAQVYLGEGERLSFNVNLAGWTEGKSGTIKRLEAPETRSLQGLTWAGQSFEGVDGVAEGELVTEPLEGDWLNIPASSIVLIELD